jgi:hypothetical protein
MNKYPFVLFYSHDLEIIAFLKKNSDKLNCTLFFTDNISKLNKLFNTNYQIFITYGSNDSEYSSVHSVIANRMRDRWIHFKEIESIERFNNAVNYCFIHNCTLPRIHIRPTFSIFTTTFNSYDKIMNDDNINKIVEKAKLFDNFTINDNSSSCKLLNIFNNIKENKNLSECFHCFKNNNIINKNNAFTINSSIIPKNILDDFICAICCNSETNDLLICPECLNLIHKECMEIWLNKDKKKKSCIYCRSYEWVKYKL